MAEAAFWMPGIIYTWLLNDAEERSTLMNRQSKLAFAALLVLGSGNLGAQQQPQHGFSEDAAAERIENLDKLKAEIKQYHDCTCPCGCYAHDMDRQADRAIAFLRQRAARKKPGEKLALVLDIDETTLSNYQEEIGADFGFVKKNFDAWAMSAQAAAIPGTLRLYKEAQKLGVSVFFITGRPEDEREATERNLRTQGFNGWDGLALRPANHGKQTTIEYKSGERAKIAAQGYTLALNVGDQWSDLEGTPEAEFSVKYPDPFYFIP
jgi:acid phosphatase